MIQSTSPRTARPACPKTSGAGSRELSLARRRFFHVVIRTAPPPAVRIHVMRAATSTRCSSLGCSLRAVPDGSLSAGRGGTIERVVPLGLRLLIRDPHPVAVGQLAPEEPAYPQDEHGDDG